MDLIYASVTEPPEQRDENPEVWQELKEARIKLLGEQGSLLPGLARVKPAEVLREYKRYQGNAGVGLLKTHARAKKHLPRLARILEQSFIPSDFLIIPYIESDFRSHVSSSRGATGLWQFTKGTGRHYGLKVNLFRDDRKDPEKSTRAAARLLFDLYEQFDDWPLALAAYNAGPARVRKACRDEIVCDYWVISRKREVPPQTRRYVPKLIAALIFLEERNLWDFTRREGGSDSQLIGARRR